MSCSSNIARPAANKSCPISRLGDLKIENEKETFDMLNYNPFKLEPSLAMNSNEFFSKFTCTFLKLIAIYFQPAQPVNISDYLTVCPYVVDGSFGYYSPVCLYIVVG